MANLAVEGKGSPDAVKKLITEIRSLDTSLVVSRSTFGIFVEGMTYKTYHTTTQNYTVHQ